MTNFTDKLCDVELDRMTAAEICIDEILTIMDRRGAQRTELYSTFAFISSRLSSIMLDADGPVDRRDRLIRVRKALTDAFPMTDEDLEAQS